MFVQIREVSSAGPGGTIFPTVVEKFCARLIQHWYASGEAGTGHSQPRRRMLLSSENVLLVTEDGGHPLPPHVPIARCLPA